MNRFNSQLPQVDVPQPPKTNWFSSYHLWGYAFLGLTFLLAVGFIYQMEYNNKPQESQICIQVITPARNPYTGETKDFPTPCDVPDEWEVVSNQEDGLEKTVTYEDYGFNLDSSDYSLYVNQKLGFEMMLPKDIGGVSSGGGYLGNDQRGVVHRYQIAGATRIPLGDFEGFREDEKVAFFEVFIDSDRNLQKCDLTHSKSYIESGWQIYKSDNKLCAKKGIYYLVIDVDGTNMNRAKFITNSIKFNNVEDSGIPEFYMKCSEPEQTATYYAARNCSLMNKNEEVVSDLVTREQKSFLSKIGDGNLNTINNLLVLGWTNTHVYLLGGGSDWFSEHILYSINRSDWSGSIVTKENRFYEDPVEFFLHFTIFSGNSSFQEYPNVKEILNAYKKS